MADRSVWTGALLAFALLEVMTRAYLFHASKDLRRFRQMPAEARGLCAVSRYQIAVIGNSAAERGVDPHGLGAATSRLTGTNTECDSFTADRSGINTWYHLIKHYFWDARLQPDLFVVLCTRDPYDEEGIDVGRLAQFLTSPADWREVGRNDVTTALGRADFALSTVWASYAVRDRLKERVMELAVPHFKQFATSVNSVSFEVDSSLPSTPRTPTYRALDLLLAEARQRGARLCFVLFPDRACAEGRPYTLSQEALKRIRQSGMPVLDQRREPDLSPAMYADAIHLGPEGQRRYTGDLARDLAAVVNTEMRMTPRAAFRSVGSVARTALQTHTSVERDHGNSHF